MTLYLSEAADQDGFDGGWIIHDGMVEYWGETPEAAIRAWLVSETSALSCQPK